MSNEFFFQSGSSVDPDLIPNSLRFRSNTYLSRTNSSSGNLYSWTYSCWVKRGTFDQAIDAILAANQNYGNDWTSDSLQYHTSNFGLSILNIRSESIRASGTTNAKYRDPSAWYHIVAVWDNTNSTAADKFRYYINGERADIAWNTTPTGDSSLINSTTPMRIGQNASVNSQKYMAEIHFVDGSILDPGTFGEYDDNGVWVPKIVSGLTYGGNGYYLDFSDPTNIGADRSGNGNNWTPTGFELANTSSTNYDLMEDSPTNNYPTLNPLNTQLGGNPTYSNANMRQGITTSGGRYDRLTTILPRNSGKVYFETTNLASTGSQQGVAVGLDPVNKPTSGSPRSGFFNNTRRLLYQWDGPTSQVPDPPGNVLGAGQTVQCAVDLEAGKLWIGVDNTWYIDANTPGGNPGAGTGATDETLPPDTDFSVTAGGASTPGYNSGIEFNAGQRPFRFTPPEGFEPLSTAALPAVPITNPSEHFQTILSTDTPDVPEPVARGEAYGGGFYAGRIKDGNAVYNIIVAPASEGSLNGEFPGTTAWNRYSSAKPLAYSETYGGTATFAYGDGGNNNYIFDWAAVTSTGPNAGTVDETNTAGTGIGGYNDWYVPAYKELELIYRTFKPTTDANNTSGGANDAAVPSTGNYTSSDPSQTSVASFQSGGANALFANPQPGAGGWYWSATQSSSNGAVGYVRQMKTGETDGQNVTTSTGNKVRAIRREFAYNAGILDYAQAAFPSGLWWIKDRANSNQHQLVDSVRGGNLAINTPNETTENAYSAPSGSSVAWCWNLAPDRSNGFDIVTYSGNSANRTIAHNLGVAPEFLMVCNRNRGGATHRVWHKAFSASSTLEINSSRAATTENSVFNNTAPTASVFSLGNSSMNASGYNYVAYLWRSVPGFSQMGSYQGNGAVDGPFIALSFRPAFLLIKAYSSTGSWKLRDTARDTYNPCLLLLGPNSAVAETSDSASSWDILSNGFKLRNGNTETNGNGWSYIYMAFAEHPFGGSNVYPSPAR